MATLCSVRLRLPWTWLLCFWVSLVYAEENVTEYLRLRRPLDYAVVGQAKSGTSTLWFNVCGHPGGHPRVRGLLSKEYAWWQTEGGLALCDNQVERYMAFIAEARARYQNPDILVGDWSTTYFSCSCCPEVMKSLNPNIRLVVMLRDPVKRALSRFMEQSRNPRYGLHHLTVNHTVRSYFEMAMKDLRDCNHRAGLFSKTTNGGPMNPAARPLPAGASPTTAAPALPLERVLEFQCYQRSNFLGWSAYDVFLENWLRHFAPSQMLAIYMDDLQDDPISVFRKFETHIGVPPHEYDPQRANVVYNSRHAYGWGLGRNKSEVVNDDSHQAGLGPLMMELINFFKPTVGRLFELANAGLIAQPPMRWRAAYGQ